MLIVIAVIAILAILTIVSYFGIAERAYNTKITDGVNQYIDAIKVHYAKNGV